MASMLMVPPCPPTSACLRTDCNVLADDVAATSVTRLGISTWDLVATRNHRPLSSLHAPADALGCSYRHGPRLRARRAFACACGASALLPADRVRPGGAEQL